jgi:UDP-N-acetylglucosamine--N-acetylmuramyl-(pentapeptide) pyrophosphoryl-undecaprenol N-acetylglucosamine transferase
MAKSRDISKPLGKAILLAGGGSGGHISPGIAIAEALRELEPSCRPMFLCSERAIDATMLSATDERFLTLPAVPFSWRGIRRFSRMFQVSRAQAREVLARESVGCVAALGGFVAAPVALAAKDMKVPCFLINLDDPPGKANKAIAKVATQVLSAIDVRSEKKFAYTRIGFPVRSKSIAPGGEAICKSQLGVDLTKPVLLVTGASQGSASLNQLMLAMLRQHAAALKDWTAIHLCGEGEIREDLEKAYRAAGVEAVVKPFVHEMGSMWGAAALALTRSGANSVAEAAVNGVPSVFLPYPYHKDQHQRRNAEPLAALGGAVVCTDHVDAAANLREAGQVLVELLGNRGKLDAMRAALESHRPMPAAREIASMLLAACRVPTTFR